VVKSRRADVSPKRARVPEVPAFGRLLLHLRQRRFGERSTPEQVVNYLADNEGAKTAGGSLRGYELGWNRSLDPIVLAALARVYRIALEDLIDVLAANRLKPNLSDFEVEQVLRDARQRRHAQAAAASRFSEIGERLVAISAELAEYATEAAELTRQDDDPRGQNAKDRERAPEGSHGD
jgi:hypothetical protein